MHTQTLFDISPSRRHYFNETERLKRAVRSRTHYALKRGEIRKGRCAICGDADTQAHHLDYDAKYAWLLIEWLCPEHHRKAHRKAQWAEGQIELLFR